MRKAILIAAMMLTTTAAFAGAPPPALVTHGEGRWRAESWQDAVELLPCWAFQKKSGGRWMMAGRINMPNHQVIMNVTFGPDWASHSLDRRCRFQH